MPRLTTLVLAGALGWPAVTFGQVWGPRPAEAPTAARPADPATASPTTPAPAERPGEKKTAEALPPVPPLPPSGPLPASVNAALPPEVIRTQKSGAVEELPKPTPTGRAPDVSGMPPARAMSAPPPGMAMKGYGMLPGTMAPTIPPVCCPPAPPECTTCNQSGCIAFGDIFTWRARQNNPVAVFERTDTTLPQAPLVFTREAVAYNTDHTDGFRAGGGYLCESGWLFLVTFTQYKDQVSNQTFTIPDLGPDSTLEVTYTGPGQLSGTPTGAVPGNSLHADWNLQYRTIDITVGTVFSPTDYLDVSVHAGARLAWIDQDYNVLVSTTDPVVGSLTTQEENLVLNLRGAGPYVACETRVYLVPCFAFYGKGATSLLLANREDVSVVTVVNDVDGVQSINKSNYNREEITPVFELAFGCETSCLDGRLLVNAGYEFLYLFELATSVGELTGSQAREPNHGDITLDGAYLRVTFLF